MAFLLSRKCIKGQCSWILKNQYQALFLSNNFKEFRTADQVMNFKNNN